MLPCPRPLVGMIHASSQYKIVRPRDEAGSDFAACMIVDQNLDQPNVDTHRVPGYHTVTSRSTIPSGPCDEGSSPSVLSLELGDQLSTLAELVRQQKLQ